MERGFRLTMTHESTHAFGGDWIREFDRQIFLVTSGDLDPARRVSAQREIPRFQ